MRQIVDLLDERPPTLGRGQLVGIDGPAGSGKTTLTRTVAQATGASVVHLDDLYDGWAGLERLDAQLETLLRPLASGQPGHYRHYDWHAGAYVGEREVTPNDLLVLDGVGSGWARYADLMTVLVWVEAPREERLRRGLARDGEQVSREWLAWQRAEDVHHAVHRTRERADLRVDG